MKKPLHEDNGSEVFPQTIMTDEKDAWQRLILLEELPSDAFYSPSQAKHSSKPLSPPITPP